MNAPAKTEVVPTYVQTNPEITNVRATMATLLTMTAKPVQVFSFIYGQCL